MAILNYTTSVPVERTIDEIVKILRNHGAKRITTEYNDDNNPCAVEFQIETPFGMRSFLLPANAEAVWKVMGIQQSEGKIGKSRQTSLAQSERVAWRVLKDWVEAQMALIETEMVSISQVMLPYMRATPEGLTVYQLMEQRQMALPSGRD